MTRKKLQNVCLKRYLLKLKIRRMLILHLCVCVQNNKFLLKCNIPRNVQIIFSKLEYFEKRI